MEMDPIYRTVCSSISDAFEVMLMAEVEFLDLDDFANAYDEHRTIATIGLGGHGVEAALNLIFNRPAAQGIVQLMMGDEAPTDQTIIEDGVGELSNMVAGGIKKGLTEDGLDFNIGLPCVMGTDSAHVSTNHATALYPFRFVVESEHMIDGVFLIRETEAQH